MSNELTLTPQASASTNPFSITFGATAYAELWERPEMIINKTLGTVNLDYVNATGIMVSVGAQSALIPWSNILVLRY